MLSMPDTIQPVVEQDAGREESLNPEPAMVPLDSPEWQQVQGLQPGTWLEFSHIDQAMARAKLSWISPMTGRYLFVNRRGLKVADYAPEELAVLLADGKATVLAGNAFFDRAMSSIVTRLSQPENPPAPDA